MTMTTRSEAMRTAGVIVGGLISFNTAFFFLASLYFKDRAIDAAALWHIRGAFLVLTGLVSVMAYIAALAPRWIGHGIAGGVAIASAIGAIEAFSHDMPAVMGMTQVVIALVAPALVWRSWQGSRPAWSFAIALLAVLAAVTFFGAPKVRALLDISLWTAMIVPALCIVGAIALAMLRRDYGGGEAAAVATSAPSAPSADAPAAKPTPAKPMPAKLAIVLMLLAVTVFVNIATGALIPAGIGALLLAGIFAGNDGLRRVAQVLAGLGIGWTLIMAGLVINQLGVREYVLIGAFGIAVPAFYIWALAQHDVRDWMFRKNFKLDA